MSWLNSEKRRAMARCVALLPEFSAASLDSLAVFLAKEVEKFGLAADADYDLDPAPPTFRVVGLPKPKKPKRVA